MVTLTFRIPAPEFAAKVGCSGWLITDKLLTLKELEHLRALKIEPERLHDGDQITIPSDLGEQP
jgi:hypothetical protein